MIYAASLLLDHPSRHLGVSAQGAHWLPAFAAAVTIASRTIIPGPFPQLFADLIQRSGRDFSEHEQTGEQEICSDNLKIGHVWVRHCGHGSLSLHALG
jgi:hypothetical protein